MNQKEKSEDRNESTFRACGLCLSRHAQPRVGQVNQRGCLSGWVREDHADLGAGHR